MKTDSSFRRFGLRRRRIQKFTDFFKKSQNGFFMDIEPRSQFPLKINKFSSQFLASGKRLAQLDEGPYDIHAHSDGLGAIQDCRGHHRTMFGEHKGKLPPPAAPLF